MAPVLFVVLQPFAQRLVVGAEPVEEVVRRADLRRRAVELAARVLEVDRVEDVAAVVALVAARALEAADRARALDVAVEQEALLDGAVGQVHLALVDVADLQQLEEHVLGDARVVLRAGGREEVEADAEALPALEELGVEVRRHLGRGAAFFLGADGDRRAVLVGAGDHQDFVAGGAVVAGEDVRRQVGADYLADVQGAVSVRPGDPDKDTFRHRADCSIAQVQRAPGDGSTIGPSISSERA